MSEQNPVAALPPATTGAPASPARETSAAAAGPPGGGGGAPASPNRPPPISKPIFNRNAVVAANAPPTGIFSHIHPMHIILAVFSLLQVGFAAVALGTNSWYSVLADNSVTYYGLFKTCDATLTVCNANPYNDEFYSDCTRTGSELANRYHVLQGLCIAGLVFSVITGLAALASKKISPTVSYVVVFLALLTAVLLFACALYFSQTFERWRFCDRHICELKRKEGSQQACDGSYGFSLAFLCIAIGAAFLSFVFSLVRVALGEWTVEKQPAATAATNEPTRAAGSPAAAKARTATPGASQQPTEVVATQGGWDAQPTALPAASEPAPRAAPSASVLYADDQVPPPPPNGDWVLDPQCKMYWSQQEFLYLDPYSRHCYDPNSDMWYDPEADEWYKGLPQQP